MKISGSIKETRDLVKEWKSQGLSVALVPTMGYLHEGHKSLMERARKENDKVVVSIFVNPMQFGPNEDLEAYPRDLDRDAKICEAAGVDLIFHPEVDEMYGPDFHSFVDMTLLPEQLCGKSRPVHFRGVQTVVSKLFHIIPAHRAYFGQKDAQQLAIIRRMVIDLDFDIEIIGCPIVREEDGLAKSSRNTYLSEEERKQAVILNQSLEEAMKAIDAGQKDAAKVKQLITDKLNTCPLAKIDYVEVVSFDN
ncbi:MAG: pantoate--beta-alanine ligase, partial [Lachnospiraceae bacterium]